MSDSGSLFSFVLYLPVSSILLGHEAVHDEVQHVLPKCLHMGHCPPSSPFPRGN